MMIYRATYQKHNKNLIKFLDRCKQHGLKIGCDNIKYKKVKEELHGIEFSDRGHKPPKQKNPRFTEDLDPQQNKIALVILGIYQLAKKVLITT